MKAAVYGGTGDIRIEERAKPEIESPTDAVVRVTHGDLWLGSLVLQR